MARLTGYSANGKTHVVWSMTILAMIIGQAYSQQFSIEDLRGSSQEALAKKSSLGTPNMWFGPRLGKRGHQGGIGPNLGLPLQRLLLEALADPKKLENFADIRPSSTNTKRRFTPRLGRESGEEIQEPKNIDFIPRLGRDLDPRLLAQLLASEDFPCSDSALFGRSVSEKSYDAKTPPFAPRLGRENTGIAGFYVSVAVTSPPPCCAGGNPPVFSQFAAPPFIPRLGRDSEKFYDSSLDLNGLKDGGMRIVRSVSSSKHPDNNNN